MVVIVDLVDMNRVLVDGMGAFPRVIYPLKRLQLTRIVVANVLRGTRTGTLIKKAKAFGLDAKWAATPANKKMEQYKTRTGLSDFQRFQVMVTRKQRSYEAKKLASGRKPAAKGKAAAKPAAKGKGKK